MWVVHQIVERYVFGLRTAGVLVFGGAKHPGLIGPLAEGVVAPGDVAAFDERSHRSAVNPLGHGQPRIVEDCGHEVDLAHRLVDHRAGRDSAGQTHRQRDPHQVVVEARYRFSDAAVGPGHVAVIGGEDDQSVVGKPFFVELVEDAAQLVVDVLDHPVVDRRILPNAHRAHDVAQPLAGAPLVPLGHVEAAGQLDLVPVDEAIVWLGDHPKVVRRVPRGRDHEVAVGVLVDQVENLVGDLGVGQQIGRDQATTDDRDV